MLTQRFCAAEVPAMIGESAGAYGNSHVRVRVHTAGNELGETMSKSQPMEPRHDHAPDTDDVWAWIIIGLVGAGVMLAIWTPML